MNAQATSPSITVIQSLPNLTFPTFKKEQQGKSVILPGIERTSVTVDLGTPNLGTAWQVDAISVYYEKLNAKQTGLFTYDMFLYFTAYLYMGSAEIFREISNKLLIPPETETVEGVPVAKTVESSLVALQSIPQPLIVPGGQQLLLSLAANETPPGTGFAHVAGSISLGKYTMSYTRVPSNV